MHVDKLYALVLLNYNLQMQDTGVFPLISNAPVTLAGEITLSCSPKVSSKFNLIRSFLLFKIKQKLCFPMKILSK